MNVPYASFIIFFSNSLAVAIGESEIMPEVPGKHAIRKLTGKMLVLR